MSMFCTGCGKPLGEGAKYCTGCGTAVLNASTEAKPIPKKGSPLEIEAVSKETLQPKAKAMPEEISPKTEVPVSKATKVFKKVKTKMKTKVRTETKAYTKKYFSDTVPAYGTAGELTLPQELTPFPAGADAASLFSLLKSGIRGLTVGFKRTLGDKKRLALVIGLIVIWLLVNTLASLGIFPLPVRLLSWLTAARGSFIGGTIGKGLVAALLAQLIADQGVFQTVKSGLGQLRGIVNSGKREVVPLLLGAGAALIACNMMASSNLQNTMVCIAAFLLSAKALVQNGFLQRLITALLPKAQNTTVTDLMRGWTLGFALFAVVSFLPGRGNGYVLGILLLLAAGIVAVVGKNKKEVTAE